MLSKLQNRPQFVGGTISAEFRPSCLSRGLFDILSDQDFSSFRPARVRTGFHFLCVGPCGALRGVLGGKAAISFQHAVVRTADFVEPCHKFCSVHATILAGRPSGQRNRNEKPNPPLLRKPRRSGHPEIQTHVKGSATRPPCWIFPTRSSSAQGLYHSPVLGDP